MKILFALFLIGAARIAFADADGINSAYFVGGGLSTGMESSSFEGTSGTSKLISQGMFLEAGTRLALSHSLGVHLSAEAGQNHNVNNLESAKNLENGTTDYYAGKLGLIFGHLTIGALYRHNEMKTKSISLPTPGYLETNYSGNTPGGFIDISYDFKNQFRGAAEIQYVSGTLKSSTPQGLDAKFNDVSFSLRVYILFQ